MVKRILFLLLFLISVRASAQLTNADNVKKALETSNVDTVAWIATGVLNMGVNQGFLHNWAAGGEVASMTVNGQFSGALNRIMHHHIWANNLEMTYGLFYAYSTGFVPRKIDDRIDVTSKYGVQMNRNKNLYFSGLFNFKSQFTRGYDYSHPNWDSFSTSRFLSPAYFTAALGLEYRRGSNVSLFLSPLAGRLTIADKYYTLMRPEGAFGIPYGETARWELGAYFSGRYQVEIERKVLFRTRLDLYSNYIAKDRTDTLGNIVKRDGPGNIDILWDNFFSWKLSRFFSISLAATFIYDNDLPYIDSYTDGAGNVTKKDEPGTGLGWWQVKEIFTLGFQYRF